MNLDQEHGKNPFVVISLLNWMNYEDTIQCIQSIEGLTYTNFEIVLCDNASPNNSYELLKERFPHLYIHQTKANNGFAAGHFANYQVAKEKQADLFWILNSDLELDSNSLTQLIKVYHENGNQIYGSVSLNPNDAEIVDFGGAVYSSDSDIKLTYNNWKNKLYKELLVQYPHFYEVESVEGSSMMIPMEIIEKFGFMKLDFFMYGEETDYCYRMRKRSVKSLIVTTSFVKHHNEGSTQQFPNLKIIPFYYRRRNAIRFFMEHFGMTKWEALSYNNGVYINLKTILKGLFSKNKEFGYFYALACFHAFLGKKGKSIQPEKLIL